MFYLRSSYFVLLTPYRYGHTASIVGEKNEVRFEGEVDSEAEDDSLALPGGYLGDSSPPLQHQASYLHFSSI